MTTSLHKIKYKSPAQAGLRADWKAVLERSYDRQALLTAPPNGCVVDACCDPLYCEAAIVRAKEVYGLDLPRTKHKRLPLMGPNGCSAAPYLRPACSFHVCHVGYMMEESKRQSFNWGQKEIDKLEASINNAPKQTRASLAGEPSRGEMEITCASEAQISRSSRDERTDDSVL